jgi:hypothetical protein
VLLAGQSTARTEKRGGSNERGDGDAPVRGKSAETWNWRRAAGQRCASAGPFPQVAHATTIVTASALVVKAKDRSLPGARGLSSSDFFGSRPASDAVLATSAL